MRTRIPVLLAAAMFGVGASPALTAAQNSPIDSRWLAYLGCWRSIEIGRESTVCLVPGAETASVDIVTIDSGQVIAAEQIAATGQRLETTRGDCTGWQSAQWSGVSDRLYLRSEETCPGWGTRTGTGLIALTHEGQLLYIQGNTIVTKTGVRIQRYREAPATGPFDVPSEVKDALDALNTDLTATARARAAAVAPLAIEDLAEASRALNVEVVEAWLVARGGSFRLDADRLIALQAAGVPSRITDLMIALSNPSVFAVDARGTRRVTTSVDQGPASPVYPVTELYGGCAMQYVLLPLYSSYCDAYALRYPYPYGWYPVSIIYTGGTSGGGSGSGGEPRSHGRVVNGRGYQEGIPASGDVGRAAQGRSTAPGGGAPAPNASASSGEQRTAKPRP
ncbi:MAG TPA: hypothetical protein VN803_04380 [Gemmatimonadales bacterium]|nr:hypothetical protein [Gemmatimonadales bacterium]